MAVDVRSIDGGGSAHDGGALRDPSGWGGAINESSHGNGGSGATGGHSAVIVEADRRPDDEDVDGRQGSSGLAKVVDPVDDGGVDAGSPGPQSVSNRDKWVDSDNARLAPCGQSASGGITPRDDGGGGAFEVKVDLRRLDDGGSAPDSGGLRAPGGWGGDIGDSGGGIGGS